ncbi:Aspartate-semialdehyde dehydrogenase 2 [bacterium HR30]|nr:Aspartate-semialdehyde dehydrogenase 2 [bacterium HR30]
MKKAAYDVAVIGATGIVGREIVAVLAERGFPLGRMRLFATRASLGQEIEGGDTAVEELAADTELSGTDIVFLACPPAVARPWRQRAVAAGAFVIDASACRGESEAVLMVVPEVNARVLATARESRCVASPHPTAVALAVVLHPLRQLAGLARVAATVLEPVSLAGRTGVELLEREVRSLLSGAEPEPSDAFPQRVAFNVCPVGSWATGFGRASSDGEEAVQHLRQVLEAPTLPVELSRVQVPVFFGLAMTVSVGWSTKVDFATVLQQLRTAPGLLLVESSDAAAEAAFPLPTPATVVGSDATHVACVGVDPDVPGVHLWVALDNTRKGSATNAVQIAELLVRDYL